MARKPARKAASRPKRRYTDRKGAIRRALFAKLLFKALLEAKGDVEKVKLGEIAIACGLSENGAKQAGSRMLSHVDVQDRLKRFVEPVMGKREILERLTEMGRADMADFVNSDGEPDFTHALATGKGRLIRSIEWTDEGEKTPKKVRLELHDAKDAQKFMAKLHGMVKENPAPPEPSWLPIAAFLAMLPLEQKRLVVKVLQEWQAKQPARAIDVQAMEVG